MDRLDSYEVPRVGVIIVSWNSFDTLKRCLTALAYQNTVPFRTLVIDNNSENAPAALSGEMPPGTRYIRLSENMGFARANNLGIQLLDDCDWIALVNPDAFPMPDWLSELLAAAYTHPQYSSFASMTLMENIPDSVDGAGDSYHMSGVTWRKGYGIPKVNMRLVCEEVFGACAAAALYSRDSLTQVGGFDEDFFCYLEDVDLAFRLQLRGYRCLFVPTAMAHHIGSTSTGGRRSDFSVYHGHRNLVWTYLKNMPGSLFWLFLPMHLIVNVISMALFAITGRADVILRAKRDAIREVPKMWKKRQTIQRSRVVGLLAILRVLDVRLLPIRRLERFRLW